MRTGRGLATSTKTASTGAKSGRPGKTFTGGPSPTSSRSGGTADVKMPSIESLRGVSQVPTTGVSQVPTFAMIEEVILADPRLQHRDVGYTECSRSLDAARWLHTDGRIIDE